MACSTTNTNFDQYWNYSKPDETREKFLEISSKLSKDSREYFELQTQIARTHSLTSNFTEAHKILDMIKEKAVATDSILHIRYLLERGRTYNSSKQKEKALPLFIKSYEIGLTINQDNYAIDAAHMVSIAAGSIEEKRKWTKIGIDKAETTTDLKAKRWIGSLTNNLGWDYHDKGEFQSAMIYFDKALNYFKEHGNQDKIFVANWTVSRCNRSLKNYDLAIKQMHSLETEMLASGNIDGYVYEELAENYLLKNNSNRTKYFKLAYTELSKDSWFTKNESKRLTRLQTLSEGKK